MLTSLFATSDLARRVAERNLDPFFIPKKPIDLHAQHVREGLEFVVKDMAKVVFDFGDRGSVKLNPEPSEFPERASCVSAGLQPRRASATRLPMMFFRAGLFFTRKEYFAHERDVF